MPRKRKRDWDTQEVRAYFEENLSGVRWRGEQGTAHCPFHDDRHPSLSINAELGVFCCHGCGTKGDLVAFECLRCHCDRQEAMKHLLHLLV